ncbi:MAG: hypothetical protein KAJ44_01285 [Thermoplasmatales archaeon]|nr:hypothetical protein [Thermoplasmatales archaeon]
MNVFNYINIFGGFSKKTSDYLKKSFIQKDNLDNAKKRRAQLNIKHKIPIKIAFIPKLSFFTTFAITPTIVVIIVKNNNKKNVISNITNGIGSQITGPITTSTNSIVIIINTIIAKKNDIIPNKLCFFISNITFTHIFKLKYPIKYFENKKTSDYLENCNSTFLVSLLRNKKLSITGQNKRERLPPKANKGHKVHRPKYLSLYPSSGKLEAQLIDTGLYTPKGKLQLSQLKLQIQSLKGRMFSTLFSYISQYPSYHINIFGGFQ